MNGNGLNTGTKFQITIKDFVVALIFIASMLTGYINLQSKVSSQANEIQELKAIIKENNLPRLNIQLDEIIKKVDKIADKLGVL